MNAQEYENIFTISDPNSPYNQKPIIPTRDSRKFNVLIQAWERHGNNKTEKETGKEKVKVLDSDKVSSWYFLVGFFVLIMCTAVSCFYILIPQHNVIEMPVFWYESLFVQIFGWWILYCARTVFDASMVLDFSQIKTFKTVFQLFLTASISASIFHCFLYLLWSWILHYNWPMPFHSLISGYATLFVIMVRLWFTFPKHTRRNATFRKQLLAFFAYNLWVAVAIYLQLSVIMTKVFTQLPENLQWIMAIFIPLIKNFGDSVSKYVIGKASGPDIVASRTVINIFSSATFSFWLVIMLGTTATDFTSVCILGVNSLINTGLCIKTIHFFRLTCDELKASKEDQKMKICKETLTELIINEVIEIFVPLAFVITYTISYYGPNAAILGNIGNDYWHFKKVESISPLIKSALIICLIDFLSTIFSAFLLWKTCQIKLLREIFAVFKKYGFILAIHAAANVNKVSKNFLSF